MRQKGLKKLKPSPKIGRWLLYLWDIFRELDATRQVSLNGGARLTYVELQAYGNLMHFPLDPWEVRALMAMDEVAQLARLGD